LDDIKQEIITSKEEGIDYFKKRKNIVAKCLFQVAMLWRESQIRNDSKHGLFNFFDISCATFAKEINLLTIYLVIVQSFYRCRRQLSRDIKSNIIYVWNFIP